MRLLDVLFAALVAIAAMATCALVYLATGTHWGLRAYAPLLQAVLSAAAIFSAWYLQDAKRQRDRADLVADNALAIQEFSFQTELAVAKLLGLMKPDLLPVHAVLTQAVVDNALSLLRQQKAALLPNTRAVKAYAGILHQTTLLSTFLDSKKMAGVSRSQIAVVYDALHGSRTAFLESVGSVDGYRPPLSTDNFDSWGWASGAAV
ncbi:hypothetical protein [Brevundimonas sp. 'scallop']|uniref:hypothetical protein n=1 Tax=Brevundimonas sp. 'scallop' TaxID=2562582 RepID=UPI0013E1A4A0|nr:hypothetical protein [Brevundimonas sp. 'scallop']QIF82550.1 hypothetical protein E4341_13120 [Brevundimonas sp. 'scallop']